jgi:voltage-gated potassium channel
MSTPATRLERWAHDVRVPLAILGLLFIVGASVFVLGPDLPTWISLLALGIATISWLAFLVDYLVRIGITPSGHRLNYVIHHPLQLLSIAIPIFRAVRVVDLLRELPSVNQKAPGVVRTRIALTAFAYAAVFVYFVALSTLYVERYAPNSTITNFGDALWWAAVTLTTVGYGDVVPVTLAGRLYAVLLMMGGVVIIGVASGTAVSYINEQVRKPHIARTDDPEA